MALSPGLDTGQYIAGAVGDIFEGAGLQQSAESYRKAAKVVKENMKLSQVSTRIRNAQLQRMAFKVIGGQQASVAGAGFSAGGSALDLFRDSTAEAAMDVALSDVQGAIELNTLKQQKISLQGQAKAADSAASASFISGAFKAILGVATLVI